MNCVFVMGNIEGSVSKSQAINTILLNTERSPFTGIMKVNLTEVSTYFSKLIFWAQQGNVPAIQEVNSVKMELEEIVVLY